MRAFASLLAASLIGLLPIATASAAECSFTAWTTYKGTAIKRIEGKRPYLFITGHKAIDADGAPTAYHPDDVGKPCGAHGAGLDCPANAGYPNTSWWPTVLAKDPAHPSKAFVQPSGTSKGFFVSMTALTDRDNTNLRDPARYADAKTMPYLVFPGPFNGMAGTGRMGDVGIAYNVGNKRMTPFVVADVGPAEGLGEASIALFKALGGVNPNPRNGSGTPAGDILYMVFPRSSADRPDLWPLSLADLKTQAEALLGSVGGVDQLAACAGE